MHVKESKDKGDGGRRKRERERGVGEREKEVHQIFHYVPSDKWLTLAKYIPKFG